MFSHTPIITNYLFFYCIFTYGLHTSLMLNFTWDFSRYAQVFLLGASRRDRIIQRIIMLVTVLITEKSLLLRATKFFYGI